MMVDTPKVRTQLAPTTKLEVSCEASRAIAAEIDFTDEDIITLYLVTMASSLVMSIAPKSPAHGHWDALRTYFQPLGEQLMELDEFLKHWNVSREELAFICDCSLTTVNHWFSQGEHRRVPSEKHKQRLAIAHHIWTTVETEPEYLQILREMYNQNRRRIR